MAVDPEVRRQLAALVRERGYERRDEPFQLTSGGWSHDYVDGKHAVARGDALRLACQAVIDSVGEPFDAVGGPTMGADALAHGVALLAGHRVVLGAQGAQGPWAPFVGRGHPGGRR